jgi:large subunit ribosomal protein L34e
MPKRSDRSKKTKFRRVSGKKSKRVFVKGKTGKHLCAVCGGVLHGVPHGKTPAQVGKLSRTERRPTAVFAGVLCSKCRSRVVEEAAKVEAGFKKMDEVELVLKKYVEKVRVE